MNGTRKSPPEGQRNRGLLARRAAADPLRARRPDALTAFPACSAGMKRAGRCTSGITARLNRRRHGYARALAAGCLSADSHRMTGVVDDAPEEVLT